MRTIKNIFDRMFKKTFGEVENVKAFLNFILPEPIKKRIDFSKLEIDQTNYISKRFDEYYSDIVARTKLKNDDGDDIAVDIFFLMEHKGKGEKTIFTQFLKYMYVMWEEDIDAGINPRVIIPVVFYHGERKWKIPQSFRELFKIDVELKDFLLDFNYILFDAEKWDFESFHNKELKDNVFLFTSLVLMKSASNHDLKSIKEVFKFWHKKGFIKEFDQALFFLEFVYETQEVTEEGLKRMLEESDIEGGEIMQTLANRLRKEGAKAEKINTARELLKNGVDINIISRATGLSPEEIEKLVSTSN
jgi:predicted transposase/invertase (TIGR01784 family)